MLCAIPLGLLALGSHQSVANEAPGVRNPLDPQVALSSNERAARITHNRSPRFSWIPGSRRLIYSSVSAETGQSTIIAVDGLSGEQRELLSGSHPTPSPDGTMIAFVAPEQGTGPDGPLQLWLADPNGLNPRQLTREQGGISQGNFFPIEFSWSPDSLHLLYLLVRNQENGPPPFQDEIARRHSSAARAYPQAATEANRTRLAYPSAKVLNVQTMQETAIDGLSWSYVWLDRDTLLFQDVSEGSTFADSQASLRARSLVTGAVSTLVTGYNRQAWYAPMISASGRRIAFIANPGQEAVFPARKDLAFLDRSSGAIRILTSTSTVYAGSWTPDERGVVVVDGRSTRRRLELVGLDGSRRALSDGDGVDADPKFSSDGRLIAWRHIDYQGRETLRVARWSGRSLDRPRDVAVFSDPLARFHVGETRRVEWRSADGTRADGVLTLPADYRADRAYPLVVVLHGGPLDGFNLRYPEWPMGVFFPHLLAQRGYVVFQPEYRSSGRLGYELIMAARASGERYRGDMEDILSGVDDLISHGIADSGRLFLLGHSNGSAEANWIIAHTDRFRASVSFEGIDPLIDWGGTGNYAPNGTFEWEMTGTPLTRPEVYHRNSAVAAANRIRTPTLFVVGGEQGQSINSPAMLWLYSALISQGIDTQFVRYPNDGHVLIRPENQADLFDRIVLWLQRHSGVE